jgi:hypothetical protein
MMKYNQVRQCYKGQKLKYVQYALQKMTRTAHVTILSGFHAVSVLCGCIQHVPRVVMTHINIIAHIVSKHNGLFNTQPLNFLIPIFHPYHPAVVNHYHRIIH